MDTLSPPKSADKVGKDSGEYGSDVYREGVMV